MWCGLESLQLICKSLGGSQGSPHKGVSMKPREERAREIQRQIGEVLLRHWDPVGVANVPEAQDEYEAYVGSVYRLLASGASAQQIAEHLVDIETHQLGFKDTEVGMLIPLAERLKRLNVRLTSEGGAA